VRADSPQGPQATVISRRGLLRGAAVAGGTVAGGAVGAVAVGSTAAQAAPEPESSAALRPPALRPGDRVRVVAPARSPNPALLERGIQVLKGWGLEVEVGAHVYDTYGYLAGTDADRLTDLNAAFRDPGIRGVFAARGGYGTQRIVDGLDVQAVRRDPRVFVGFSDLTSLHGRLWRGARMSTFYGPLMSWVDSRTGPESIESLRRAVMTTDPITLARDPAEPSAAVEVPGKATGILLGGTLTMLDTGFGTGDFPNLDRAILLFEDVDEAPYSYDRMLTHLRRAGALRRVAGVAIGQLVNAGTRPGEWDAPAAIKDRLADLGVPVLGGLRIGHGNGQLTVPLGVKATIDTAAGTLTVEPGVRAAA
jgi:muramoyltetrapeptide carboxypeptidase